jgi:hypothetical protein
MKWINDGGERQECPLIDHCHLRTAKFWRTDRSRRTGASSYRYIAAHNQHQRLCLAPIPRRTSTLNPALKRLRPFLRVQSFYIAEEYPSNTWTA